MIITAKLIKISNGITMRTNNRLRFIIDYVCIMQEYGSIANSSEEGRDVSNQLQWVVPTIQSALQSCNQVGKSSIHSLKNDLHFNRIW
jgi:hypothetical protein